MTSPVSNTLPAHGTQIRHPDGGREPRATPAGPISTRSAFAALLPELSQGGAFMAMDTRGVAIRISVMAHPRKGRESLATASRHAVPARAPGRRDGCPRDVVLSSAGSAPSGPLGLKSWADSRAHSFGPRLHATPCMFPGPGSWPSPGRLPRPRPAHRWGGAARHIADAGPGSRSFRTARDLPG